MRQLTSVPAVKRGTLLLIGSLAANAALVAWLGLYTPERPVPVLPAATVAPAPWRGPTPLTAAQGNALKSGDPAQMKAAGVPDEVANILAAGRAFAKTEALEQAHKKLRAADPRYWRNSAFDVSNLTDEQRAAEAKAQEEFEVAMRRAFPDYDADDGPAQRYPYLAPVAREKLARIEKDYAEIEAEINSRAEGGVLLPSDRAKLEFMRDEKRRDIAAALSSAELQNLQLHDFSSETVQTVRSRYGDAIQSESDYRKIVALQKAYDDRYPFRAGTAISAAQNADNARLQADIRAVIGEENYAAFQHDHDQSYKDLTAITRRLELPANTPDVVYAVRDRYALQSEALYRDTSLTEDDRRAQLKALGDKARADLQTKLGSEGAEAYAERDGSWLKLLKNGTAFSTNPKDAPVYSNAGNTVYPLAGPRR